MADLGDAASLSSVFLSFLFSRLRRRLFGAHLLSCRPFSRSANVQSFRKQLAQEENASKGVKGLW